MDRKNDALGRTFTETEFVPRTSKNKDGKEVVTGYDRVPVPSAERVYTIAGRFTRALSDAEVRGEFPPLYDASGKALPSVFPTAFDTATKPRKSRR